MIVPPVHVVLALGIAATVIPVGKVSLKSSKVAATSGAELSIVKVNVDVAPCSMDAGVKALANPGADAAVTVSVSVAVPLVPDEELSAADTFTALPTSTAVTSTEIVQLPPAATVPPA